MIPVISTWLLHKELAEERITFPEALRFLAREVDAMAVEIPRTTYPDWSRQGQRNLKRMLHENGMFCAAIAAQNHFNCLSLTDRRAEVALVRDFVDYAEFLGARVLNTFHAGWGDREQGRRLKDEMLLCLQEVTAYAERKSVMLALESHGPLTDNVAEFRQLFVDCPSEWLRLNFDTGNLYEGPEGNLKLLDLTCHAHVKSTYRDLDGVERDAEVERVLRALKASGYRGTVTMESVKGDPLKTLPAAFAEFKAMLAAL